ncbi:MAG: YqeG family HAD IIIA-type phosphatase [Oscillospiraceae bacterium]|nr:YqeG family HAD IIIA-type phosphatase [Oscillospiraceae bacterium]
MSFSPLPDYSFTHLTDINPDFLLKQGIKFLMLDLDNTIAAYDEKTPTQEIISWVEHVKAKNIDMFIVSNSLRKKRVGAFANALEIGAVLNARKPSPNGVFVAMAEAHHTPDHSAFIGDQIFTDTLAANRAGVLSIIVTPKKLTNPLLALRYLFEAPFRARGRNHKALD